MSDTERRFQFYGRRKGKTLRPHHAKLFAELLPEIRFDPARFAASQQPVHLEIGFGGGEHLAHQALLYPEIRFIGAEPYVNGVAKLLALIEAKKIGNIAVHAGDVRELFALLPDASLERIYLLYPDPWPKARHQRRRMVSQENLRHFRRLLKPGGLFLFASDIEHYVQWTLFETRQAGGFTWTAEGPNDWRTPFPDWIVTRYEAKAKREGRVSSYLTFRRDE
ncbi:tRNA (guanosine(46)-N7)-methyltransferase TrmB [Nordella sp. HKS 07]|uniref:tRNA (guanosine(46)-N7)-methyltransferase TrmB n=1 Tax=Nordella sp. HKS 07 TaxID=2712222 RepID=UPI0013E13AB7|nr:tRNA (guanosine(46)-N7)-methyltransferase TrmB [Nordella sp. HKS 07]QIG47477.1 tRNA (guanosine(46)-N7)-methyltransferase TrmB [Nordella sp. HKS 07]